MANPTLSNEWLMLEKLYVGLLLSFPDVTNVTNVTNVTTPLRQ